MLGKITIPKYRDPRSPLIIVTIDNTSISNMLVDLEVAINVMTYEIMIKIGCIEAKPTSTILQLVDSSTIISYGIIKDVLIMVDSWEYLVDFMIITIKLNMVGYLIILGRLWLAIIDSHIEYRTRKISISNGENTKNIIIYTPT